MGTSDGTVVGATKILDHGSDTDRWTMVLVAEGYRSSELAQFHTDAQNFVNTLVATAPFNTLQAAINVYRLDVSSTDSGADDPTACGGSGATPATYFDARFCNSGIRRLLQVNDANVISAVNANVVAWNMIMVLVNSTVYGGSGGSVATFSKAPSAIEIGLHEMGHTAFGLADEYEYWAGCSSGETGHDHHPASEPSQPNVTINSNRTTIKWASLILASTPMPTTTNANCAFCDPQPNPQPASTVGAYEGAHYYHCGAYRPQFDCRMRALNNPFCAVCSRVINATLTPHLPPKGIFKDLKDHKLEKLEKIEKHEKIEKLEKIEKHEKFEKLEKIEKLEKLEHKELKPEIEVQKLEIEIKLDEVGGLINPGDIVQRLDDLEGQVKRLEHFITQAQRPDLARGALAAETDVTAGNAAAESRPKSRKRE